MPNYRYSILGRSPASNGVQRVFVDEEIGYSNASQYPIYPVFLALNDAKEVPATPWERSFDYTNRVKNSPELFLRSEAMTYTIDLNRSRNLWGAIRGDAHITQNQGRGVPPCDR